MTGSPSIVNLRSSPLLSTSLCASLGLKLPPLRLPDPLSPPNPPEPPDPPDCWPNYLYFFVAFDSPWGFFRSPLLQSSSFLCTTPPRSQISDLRPSFSLTGTLVSSGGTPSLTAICRLFSGLYPAYTLTRFVSGFVIYFPTVSRICWLDSGFTSLISWKCVPCLVTFAYMKAWLVYKALVSHLPWLCVDHMCHVYSFMEQFVVLLFPPCGFKCNVGTKIFSGVARWLTLSSPRGMGWCFSDVSEVPLFDGVRRCYVFLATLVEGIDLKASLVAKEGSVFDAFNSDLSSGASLPGCRCVYASSVEFANSHLFHCFCLNYGCSFSFLICLTMLWVIEFACLAPSSLLYPPPVENS
ncbi:hypothetical protein ISN44_As07g015760 [Arabidopsis suecica]|uniref:Uncharacterized protein n=1 Tax=Arabidopsis suecica TaxID=45249 RepID=A0A8T2BUC6_ARASU|nr:hypothetical protein ISN44_As07g015760 [Arabidopsis suecica]